MTTRPFLSAPMRAVHAQLGDWMRAVGMRTHIDAAGNLRGVYDAAAPCLADGTTAPTLFVGSHLDTVPRAGAFDGPLGVAVGIALIESLEGSRLPFAIEVIGFSEEEGVRFGVPFIGSRALVGDVDETLLARRDQAGRSIAEAIADFGLDPSNLAAVRPDGPCLGYLEVHIEQGPMLDDLELPIGVVDAIAGQSRVDVVFTGAAAHAGTTPRHGRRDALAAAAEWVSCVEREMDDVAGLMATAGSLQVEPGVANVIVGRCAATLDVRHADDRIRNAAVTRLATAAHAAGRRRGVDVGWTLTHERRAVAMDAALARILERAVARAGVPRHRITSGAGHDAMVVAALMPAAMLFVRSPGGISHHPDEWVHEGDVAAALCAMRYALDELAADERFRGTSSQHVDRDAAKGT